MNNEEFQSLLEDLGFTTRSYQGRGMSRECLGAVSSYESMQLFLAAVVSKFEEKIDSSLFPRVIKTQLHTLCEYMRECQYDRMGKGYIYYFPSLVFLEPEDDSSEDENDS